MHRGTADYGHNFAFIRPNISDDRWYNFNDSSVTEVTKSYAIHQGTGGDYCHYDFIQNVFPTKNQPPASLNYRY